MNWSHYFPMTAISPNSCLSLPVQYLGGAKRQEWASREMELLGRRRGCSGGWDISSLNSELGQMTGDTVTCCLYSCCLWGSYDTGSHFWKTLVFPRAEPCSLNKMTFLHLKKKKSRKKHHSPRTSSVPQKQGGSIFLTPWVKDPLQTSKPWDQSIKGFCNSEHWVSFDLPAWNT